MTERDRLLIVAAITNLVILSDELEVAVFERGTYLREVITDLDNIAQALQGKTDAESDQTYNDMTELVASLRSDYQRCDG